MRIVCAAILLLVSVLPSWAGRGDMPLPGGSWEFQHDRPWPAEGVGTIVPLDDAARQRAAGYASYGAGIHAASHLGEEGNSRGAVLEKYLSALAQVDAPLTVYLRIATLLAGQGGDGDDAGEGGALPADSAARVRAVLTSRGAGEEQELCLALWELDYGDAATALPLLRKYLVSGGAYVVPACRLLVKYYLNQDLKEPMRGLLAWIEESAGPDEAAELRLPRMRMHLRLGDLALARRLAWDIVEDEDTYRQPGVLNELLGDLERIGQVELVDAFLAGFLDEWGDRLDQEDCERLMAYRMRRAVESANAMVVEDIADMAAEMRVLPDRFILVCLSVAQRGMRDSAAQGISERCYCDAAVVLLEELLRRQPAREAELRRQLSACHALAGRYGEAARELQRLPVVGLTEGDLIRLAALLQRLGRHGDALECYARLERLPRPEDKPLDESFFASYGIAAEEAGDTELALKVIRRGYQAYPDSPTLANALGYTLADHGLELPRARELVAAALAREPASAAYLDSLAWVQYRQGEFREALRTIRLALANLEDGWYSPENAEILGHLADILEALGEHAAAQCWRPAKPDGANE